MNYTYHIITTTRTKSGPYQQIQEIDSNGFFITWSIGELFNSVHSKSKTSVGYESFKRTRNWILKNYPELLI